MWLKTKDGLVNMDRVATVSVYTYEFRSPPTSEVDAMIQTTSNEDQQLSVVLFKSPSVQSCYQFIDWLYSQLATGVRVADVQNPFRDDLETK